MILEKEKENIVSEDFHVLAYIYCYIPLIGHTVPMEVN